MNQVHTITIAEDMSKREMWMMQFIMILPCFFIKLQLDNDAYWLIQAGRSLWENGIPHVDPLSMHEGLHYVMQQWLTAGFYAYLYDSVGAIGILIFVLAIFISIVLVMFRLCILISKNNMLVSYIITITCTIVLFFFMTTRPYPISMLIFLIELYILESYLESRDKRYLVALPVLSVALINFHGAIWPFFFIILIPYLIDSIKFKIGFIQGEGYPKTFLAVSILVSFLAGFLNPYGWELMTYLFRSYGNYNISTFVQEMKSPNFQNSTGMYFFTIFLFVVIILIQSRPKRQTLRYGLLMLGTAYMAFSSMRNLSLFAICGFPMLSYSLRDFNPVIHSTNTIRSRTRIILLTAMCFLVLCIFSFRLYDSQSYQESKLPKAAVDYIINNYDKEQLRLFADYNWGGYTEFRGLKPFIDARAEVFLKANNGKMDILDDLIALRTGKMHYQKFINKYSLNVFLIEKKELLEEYLSSDPRYVLVFQDESSVVYEKGK